MGSCEKKSQSFSSVQSRWSYSYYSYRDFAGKVRHVIMLNLFIGWFNLAPRTNFNKGALHSSLQSICPAVNILSFSIFFVTVILREDILPVNL